MSSEPFRDKLLMKGDVSDPMATEAESDRGRGCWGRGQRAEVVLVLVLVRCARTRVCAAIRAVSSAIWDLFAPQEDALAEALLAVRLAACSARKHASHALLHHFLFDPKILTDNAVLLVEQRGVVRDATRLPSAALG